MATVFDNSLGFALAFVKAHPGWYIFPIHRYGKKPHVEDNLKTAASNDPEQIKKWHRQWPGCNWGLALSKSRVIVVDVDVKNGKLGLFTLAYLKMVHGDGFTLTMKVQSPTGGEHYYFQATKRVEHKFVLGDEGKGFGPGIDSPNYVLIPGCYVFEKGKPGGGYDLVTDAAMIDAPDWFAEHLPQDDREKKKADSIPLVDLDAPAEIAWAIDYLTNTAPPSIAGQNGNQTLLTVAALLKDKGISEEMAIELLDKHYNVPGKCDPMWSIGNGPEADRLDVVVHNAWLYLNENAPGSDTSEAAFGDDPVPQDHIESVHLVWEQLNHDRRHALNEVEDGPPDDNGSGGGAAKGTTRKDRAKEAARKVDARPANEDGRMWTLAEIKEEWVYIESIKRFVMRHDYKFRNWVYDVEAFDKAFMYLKGTSSFLSKRLLEQPNRTIRRFNTWAYLPGQDEFCGPSYNLYRPGKIKPIEGDTSRWDEHLTFLLDDEEREHLLNWCAWLLQNIDRKPRHALLLTGFGQGTGKTFVAKVLGHLLGTHNVATVTNKALDSQFNEWALKTKLVLIEELQALDRGVVKETLHDLISETEVMVNDKNVKRQEVYNCFGVMAMSNEDAAISLKDNDRRYLVLRTHATPKPLSYYNNLYKLLGDESFLSAVYHQLLTRDLGEYSGEGRAPSTKAKEEMIEAGMTDLERTLVEMDGDGPLGSPITCINDIIRELPSRVQRMPRIVNQVASFLKHRKGGIIVGQFRLPDGRRERLWRIGRGSKIDISSIDPVAVYTKYNSAARKAADHEAAADFAEDPAE